MVFVETVSLFRLFLHPVLLLHFITVDVERVQINFLHINHDLRAFFRSTQSVTVSVKSGLS